MNGAYITLHCFLCQDDKDSRCVAKCTDVEEVRNKSAKCIVF